MEEAGRRREWNGREGPRQACAARDGGGGGGRYARRLGRWDVEVCVGVWPGLSGGFSEWCAGAGAERGKKGASRLVSGRSARLALAFLLRGLRCVSGPGEPVPALGLVRARFSLAEVGAVTGLMDCPGGAPRRPRPLRSLEGVWRAPFPWPDSARWLSWAPGPSRVASSSANQPPNRMSNASLHAELSFLSA